MLRRTFSFLAASAVVLSVGIMVSATGAGAAPADIVVIGDQVGVGGGSISQVTGYELLTSGPAAGVPTVMVDPVGHTVTLAVNEGGRAATITLAWPMRLGVWQLKIDPTGPIDPEQKATLTRGADRCSFMGGVLQVYRAEVAADGGVAALSADVNGRCDIEFRGSDVGAAVRIGETDPTRAVAVPRAQPASFASGALSGTVVRHQVTVTNSGGRPWKVSAVGTGASVGWSPSFKVEAGSDTCTGATLAPGGQCSVGVSATASTSWSLEQLVVTGDGPAMLVVPIRLDGYLPVAAPTGVSTLPGRLTTTVTWDAPASQPRVGYRVYDTTGGRRTLVASTGKAETSMRAPGSGVRSLALVAVDDEYAESPDVALTVPAVTSEVVTNNGYGPSVAFATDLPGTPPRPIGLQFVDLDPSRTLWVEGHHSDVSVCRVDTAVCTPVPGTATVSPATDPQDAAWLPDGSIAFTRGAESQTRTLWVVRPDGSGLRQVAAVPDCVQLAATPGGSEVVLRSNSVWWADSIERIRLSDGHQTTVPGTDSVDNFTVSSRGLLVLERRLDPYASTNSARTTTVMNIDGSGAWVLPLPAGDNRNVTFDPTGTRVAFSRFTAAFDSAVWVARADGSSPRSLTGSNSYYTTSLVWSVDKSAVASTAGFTGTAPVRVLDTRYGTGAPKARLGAGRTLTLAVPNLPAGTTAVALNVTATGPSAASNLTLYPGGQPRPLASNLNFAAGQTIPNMVVVPVGPGNTVTFYNSLGSVNVIADVLGRYAIGTGAGFTGRTPVRVLDSRSGVGAPKARLGAGRTVTLTVPNLPAGTTAVALNVTATGSTVASNLTVYPGGHALPLASNLNYTAGQTIPNMVMVPVGPGNTVTFYNSLGSVNVIADVLGSFAPGTGAGFTGRTPVRVLDTRYGTGAPAAKLGAGRTVTLNVPGLPAGTTAVALNVTATGPTAASNLTVYPGGQPLPLASSLNYLAGQTIPNMVMVPVGPGNTVTFYNSLGSVNVIADVLGCYS